ncbi:hypothetical protein MK514_07525 [Streptococcus gordonii]|uniref:hypothetical protein n=1 Tax=Streptococcus gordonii TaxID=1302 RepID=UPI001CBCEA3E|nr:hypothetical protein [Streptococcus gordonii]MBZ2135292.1 hypothetical protein [Streptococcus gordonii]MCY7130962.1 hypothetical protein [Streptococcus gordonii]MCY7141485.1 hypothetical protein [Streptococcus gordonii]
MSNKEINQELSQTRNEISPEIDNEKNKEKIKENQSIDEANGSEQVVKDSKEIKYTSALLSFSFFSSIIYLILFVSLFSIALPWGIVLLIFLGPSLICFLIATILTRIGMTNGRKGLLYASSGIYLISAFCAGDPDWHLFQIAPFVFAALVLFGTLMAKEEKR